MKDGHERNPTTPVGYKYRMAALAVLMKSHKSLNFLDNSWITVPERIETYRTILKGAKVG